MTAQIKRKNPNAAREVYERMGKSTNQEVAVGFPEGKAQAYPDGTQVVFVAACHVYGMGVPRRDFMRMALGDIGLHTKDIMAKAASVDDPKVREKLMEAAGQLAQADIQRAITDLSDPPNAPSTIAAKGSDNPLIDTSHMVQSVTYIVRDKTK